MLSGIALITSCGDTPPIPKRLPHILLVTSDTLRADHLSLSGYVRNTSPNLDAFAEQADHYAQAITVIPKTAPSFTTILSGLHPLAHGVTANRHVIPQELTLVAEQLRERGYRTAAFLGNPVLARGLGYERGFDVFRLFGEGHVLADVNTAFFQWAQAPWEQPTFVWIHYLDPHGPYKPPAGFSGLFLGDDLARGDSRRVPLEYDRMPGFLSDYVLGAVPRYQQLGMSDRVAHYISQYDSEIRSMDSVVGELFSYLRKRDLFDPSGIIFTSDHGESLGEHDYYFEHGWFAYEASLRVPLLIKAPGQKTGRRIEQMVSSLDLEPTILALAGLADDSRQGRSLLIAPELDRAILIMNSALYPQAFLGVRTSRYKYLVEAESRVEELYDLQEDPEETNNLATTDPRQLSKLRRVLGQLLEQYQRSLAQQEVIDPGQVSEETRRFLNSLGYTK